MKSFYRIGIIAAALLVAFSCQRRQSSGRAVCPFTEALLRDTACTDFRKLSFAAKNYRKGNIYVIGEPRQVRALSQDLLGSDRFNNISGKASPDGLHDFAGETFAAILDELNSPYDTYISSGKEDSLCAVNVRNYLSALDTCYFLNNYDLSGAGRKKTAKIVILASSLSSMYGYYDIDSLNRVAGSKAEVVTPLHAMLEEAGARFGKNLNIGIWAPSGNLASGIYTEVLKEHKRNDGPVSQYTIVSPVFGPDSLFAAFIDFMKRYSSSESGRKLSAVIVDDWNVDIDSLRSVVSQVKNISHDSLLNYKMMLGGDFDVIGIKESVSKACYRRLRSGNLFTHRISYPRLETFKTEAAHGDGAPILVGQDVY